MSGADVLHYKRTLYEMARRLFSVALMIELVPSIMVQGNSVSASLAESFSFNRLYTGIGIAF